MGANTGRGEIMEDRNRNTRGKGCTLLDCYRHVQETEFGVETTGTHLGLQKSRVDLITQSKGLTRGKLRTEKTKFDIRRCLRRHYKDFMRRLLHLDTSKGPRRHRLMVLDPHRMLSSLRKECRDLRCPDSSSTTVPTREDLRRPPLR